MFMIACLAFGMDSKGCGQQGRGISFGKEGAER